MIGAPPNPEPKSTLTSSAEAAGHLPQKHTQRFRRAANAVQLNSDQQRRQAGVMSAGWRALGSRDAMLTFFNAHSDELGGRPLDIAIDSDDGFAKIIAKLSDIGGEVRDRLPTSAR